MVRNRRDRVRRIRDAARAGSAGQRTTDLRRAAIRPARRSGHTGNSVENRGDDGSDAVWPMTELQELLDEWIVAGGTGRTTGCANR